LDALSLTYAHVCELNECAREYSNCTSITMHTCITMSNHVYTLRLPVLSLMS